MHDMRAEHWVLNHTTSSQLPLQLSVVFMDLCDWPMELPQEDEWKYVSMECGALCVMMPGMLMMPELSADNLDYHSQVRKKKKLL